MTHKFRGQACEKFDVNGIRISSGLEVLEASSCNRITFEAWFRKVHSFCDVMSRKSSHLASSCKNRNGYTKKSMLQNVNCSSNQLTNKNCVKPKCDLLKKIVFF